MEATYQCRVVQRVAVCVGEMDTAQSLAKHGHGDHGLCHQLLALLPFGDDAEAQRREFGDGNLWAVSAPRSRGTAAAERT